jgi:hypothetical protein
MSEKLPEYLLAAIKEHADNAYWHGTASSGKHLVELSQATLEAAIKRYGNECVGEHLSMARIAGLQRQ